VTSTCFSAVVPYGEADWSMHQSVIVC